jgi:hypothetical protein
MEETKGENLFSDRDGSAGMSLPFFAGIFSIRRLPGAGQAPF